MSEHEPYYIYDDSELQGLFKKIIARYGNLQDANEKIGEIVKTSILRNFEEGGRPNKWAKLKDSTIELRKKQGKWPGQILVRRGMGEGLMGAVSYKAASNKVVFVGNKDYSAIHHFGGMAGKGRKTKIPARPYMVIQDEDWEEIKETLNDYIIEGEV